MALPARPARPPEGDERLRDTDGFLVESSEADVGWVEEIWLGKANEPRALALRTTDGRRALLLGEDVLAVDRDQRWVVVPPRPTLLELAPPQLVRAADDGGRIVASWATTGAPLPAPARPARRRPLRVPGRRRDADVARRRARKERPVWHIFAFFYALIAFAVVFVISMAFLLAWLVTGSAY